VVASKTKCDELRRGLELDLGPYEKSMSVSELVHRTRVVGEIERLAAGAERLAYGVCLLLEGRETTIPPFGDGGHETAGYVNRDWSLSSLSDECTGHLAPDDVLEPV
jgi:hypothetical protein